MEKAKRETYFFFIFLTIIVTNNDQVTADSMCPPPASISPCSCAPYSYLYYGFAPINNAIEINCANLNLNDFQISTVLNAVLSSPGFSLVYKISATFNQLTRFPLQISKFPSLSILDLSGNRITEIPCDDGKPFMKNRFTNGTIKIDLAGNEIRRIPSGVFHFPFASFVEIDLQYNKKMSIASGAFRFPSATRVFIDLRANQLSVIPEGIYNLPSILQMTILLQTNKIREIPSGSFNFPLVREVTIRFCENEIESIPLDALNFPLDVKYVDMGFYINKIPTIPCGKFNYPLADQVGIDLSSNPISTIPLCAFNFPSASYVGIYLAYNSITAIPSGVFNFPSATSINLSLKNNKISIIAPNSFAQGRYINLDLQNNQLKRFDSAVFKFPLNSFKFGGYKPMSSLDITGNPIDCSTDPCHLSWLFQSTNSSQLIGLITGYNVCSNRPKNDFTAPPFSALNSFDFSNTCHCSYD